MPDPDPDPSSSPSFFGRAHSCSTCTCVISRSVAQCSTGGASRNVKDERRYHSGAGMQSGVVPRFRFGPGGASTSCGSQLSSENDRDRGSRRCSPGRSPPADATSSRRLPCCPSGPQNLTTSRSPHGAAGGGTTGPSRTLRGQCGPLCPTARHRRLSGPQAGT